MSVRAPSPICTLFVIVMVVVIVIVFVIVMVFIRVLACEISDLTSKTHSALRKTWPARVASSVVKF